MVDTKKAAGSQVPATTKEKLDSYVSRTLEHLQSLADTGNLVFPKDYSPENACKGASLHLVELRDKDKNLAIDVCTPASIVNAIMGMCIDGLSVWKKQGYFIVYGDQLTWQKDYRGNILIAKRDADVKEVNAQVVYDGDELVYNVDVKTGRTQLVSHETEIENQDINKIKGAYAVVVFNDGTTQIEIMTIVQIKQAWLQGFGGGNTKAHQNFTDRMCRKTVINRATNNLIGSADDSEILPEEDSNKPTKARDVKVKESAAAKHLNVSDIKFEEVDNTPVDQTENTDTTVGEEVNASGENVLIGENESTGPGY